MAKVTMNDSFPVSGGRLWQTVGGLNALPGWDPALESSTPEEGGSELTRFEGFESHGASEDDIGQVIEGGFQIGFENLNELFGR